MADHISAIKRNRQSIKRNIRNRAIKAEIQTLTKKLNASTGEDAKGLLKTVQSKVAKAGRKNIFHKRAAAKRISKLMKAAAKAA